MDPACTATVLLRDLLRADIMPENSSAFLRGSRVTVGRYVRERFNPIAGRDFVYIYVATCGQLVSEEANRELLIH